MQIRIISEAMIFDKIKQIATENKDKLLQCN